MLLIPSNLMMLLTLLISTLMVISSSNWLMMWAGLELNLLSFIPLMMHSKSHKEIEASTKYFLSQALGSALMVTFSIIMWSELMNNITMFILTMAIMIKLGGAPCHFWFPSVMSSISWLNCMILTTWQKIAPLMIILFPLMSTFSSKLMMIIAPMNAILGGLLGMNQSRLKPIMAYSSITHTGWILSAILMNMSMMATMYFLMYTIIVIPMFMIMYMINSESSTQLNKSLSSSITYSMTLAILFMSLGGLPPLTGFFPKLIFIELMSQYSYMIIMTLILGSLMNLFFYLNLSFNIIMSNQTNSMNMMPLKAPIMMSVMAFSMLGLMMFIP